MRIDKEVSKEPGFLAMGNKGQYLVVSLLATLMTIFAFVAVYPIMKAAIDAAVLGMDVYSATMLELAPFFVLLSIILTIVFASLPMKNE
jgi:hypothetical protein